jgi:ribosomal-protein-alanine N-acetyltransferase
MWKGAEPTIETQRFILRALKCSDAEDILLVESDPEVTYFRGMSPLSPEESGRRLHKQIDSRRSSKRAWMFWCIRSKADGAFLGITMLRLLNKEWREYEVGYSLARSQWGQGFGTEATRATLGFAFRELNAHRIVANTYPQNLGSRRVLEKLGFRLEAEQRESYWEHGEWQDNVQYALLQSDFCS